MLVPMLISNMAAAMISIKYGLYGPTMSPVTACSIGNASIGEAFRLIRAGGADVVIAGGTEADVALPVQPRLPVPWVEFLHWLENSDMACVTESVCSSGPSGTTT